MKQCPDCEHSRRYRLADGRYKCIDCGRRYSCTSVWDSVRLPEATKQRLLEFFAFGVPAYRQRFRSDASVSTRERFYRLARASCAREERLESFARAAAEKTRERRETLGWYVGEHPTKRLAAFSLIDRGGRIEVLPLSNTNLAERCMYLRPGHLCYAEDNTRAYACLGICGDRVVLQYRGSGPASEEHRNNIDRFWNYARHGAHTYHSVPAEYFHLYLGELCYRFNHRDQDLNRLLHRLLRHTSIREVKPLLTEMLGVRREARAKTTSIVALEIVKEFDAGQQL